MPLCWALVMQPWQSRQGVLPLGPASQLHLQERVPHCSLSLHLPLQPFEFALPVCRLSEAPLHFPLHRVCLTSLFNFFFNFKIFFFFTWTIFEVCIKFITILFLGFFVVVFHVLVFWPWVPWNLSSPARDRTCTLALEGNLNHWTTWGVPVLLIYLPIRPWPWHLFIHRP